MNEWRRVHAKEERLSCLVSLWYCFCVYYSLDIVSTIRAAAAYNNDKLKYRFGCSLSRLAGSGFVDGQLDWAVELLLVVAGVVSVSEWRFANDSISAFTE